MIFKKTYIIGILVFVIVSIAGYVVVDQLSHLGSTTGGRGPNYPYFITTGLTTVKKIVLPKGTKLIYREHFFKEGKQTQLMNEKNLWGIELPEGETIDWGGVPVLMIVQFYNPEMQGYSVYPDFKKLSNDKKTKFSKLWEAGCIDALGITVKNADDWSFNSNNITKVDDCGVNNLYYIDDKKRKKQEQLPDELYKELKKVK